MGGLGANAIDGGAGGADVLRYDWQAGPVEVDLGAGTAVGAGFSDMVAGIEAVVGTAEADTIAGGAEANYFSAGLGNDVLAGGAGDDTIAAGEGRDTIAGGDGADLVDFAGAGGAVFVDLAGGVETATGTVLTTIEAAIGGAYADVLTGDGARNYLSGGAGDDTLAGGQDGDTLIGGAGADRLVYDDGYDVIFGFQTGVDVIDATGLALQLRSSLQV